MKQEELKKLCLNRNICQLGIMCDDIYKTMNTLIEDYHLGPWDFYTHSENTLQNVLFRENYCEPHFKFYCAVANVGNIQIELIQPLYGMPFYSRFLEEHGPGLHHIKEKVPPEQFDATLESYRQRGMEPLFGASLFESRFCFINSLEKYGIQLEIGNGQSPSSVPTEWKKTYPEE